VKKFIYVLIAEVVLLLFLISNYSSATETEKLKVQSIIKRAIQEKLYEQPEWKILTHSNGKESYITDPSFILSYPNFTLKNELIATLNAFFETAQSSNPAICKFPARFLWLKEKLNLNDSTFQKVKCPEFETYLKKAPADEIYLEFVSENVSDPTSMMGHVFLKFKGKNYKGRTVEHAVSFFAVIDTTNPFSLIIESTILGMEGAFSLLPYRFQLKRYLSIENRNIWEYKLKLSDFRKKLIHYHVWELKDVKQKYYYTNYNCATVVYYILSLANPKLLEEKGLFITPRKVVKNARKHGLIETALLRPSTEWLIRMLEQSLPYSKKIIAKESVKKNPSLIREISDSEDGYLTLMLIDTYTKFLASKGKISERKLSEIQIEVKKKENILRKYTIDFSKYKSPFDVPDETQISMGIYTYERKNYLYLHFLPASHDITDNNRNYFTETSLKIGEISLLARPKDVKLLSLYLYRMRSLNPLSLLIKSVSKEVKIGFERHLQKNLQSYITFTVEGGVGLCTHPQSDTFIYLMFNTGSALGNGNAYIYGYPEIGLILYEAFNMKTVIDYSRMIRISHKYNKISIHHSIFLKQNIKIGISADRIWNTENDRYNWGVYISFYF